MALEKRKWAVLAEGLPTTLVTNKPASELEPNESPSATNLNPASEGMIASIAAIPSGTTRVARTYTVSATNYTYHYERLWRISTTQLIYGAPLYTAAYFAQHDGAIDFNDDTNSLLAFLPVGETGMVVFKSTGGYVILNAADHDGRFRVTDFIQEAHISTATHCCELNGLVYFCNTDGLFSINQQGAVQELSFPIRGTITPAAITADYKNQWIIIGSSHVYDTLTKRWFKYDGSTFYWQSRELRSAGGGPFSVTGVRFDIEKDATTSEGTITFSTQVDDRGWSTAQDLIIGTERGEEKGVGMQLEEPDSGKTFELRITSLPSDINIKRVYVDVSEYTVESRDS